MKHFLFICALMFFLGACESSDQFASVGDDAAEEQQLASETPVYQAELQSMVTEEAEETRKKVGGKKREQINVVETVGEKNFDDGQTVIVTNIEVKNVVRRDKAESSVEVIAEAQTSRASDSGSGGAGASPAKKLDILFYMKTRADSCVREFNALSKEHDFISQLEEAHWNIGFAFYAEKGAASLLPLEIQNGRPLNAKVSPDSFFDFDLDFEADYVLSKGEYPYEKARELFNTTLAEFDPNKSPSRRADDSSRDDKDYNSNGYVADPLSGLEQLLSEGAGGLIRPGSQTAVLLFDYDFPYYPLRKWKKFFKKRPNVSLVVLAHRSANVSNLHLHSLDRKHDVKFIDACGGKDSFLKLPAFLKTRAR